MSWWTCIKGAAQYLTGHERSEMGQAYVAAVCAACPSMQKYREEELHGACKIGSRLFASNAQPFTGWCGEPGQEDKEGRTCGCLVLAQDPQGVKVAHATITINGARVGMSAAGKTTKAQQECPQGKWDMEPVGEYE